MRTGNEVNIRETAAKVGYGAVMRMVVNHKYLCFNAFQSALKTLKTLLEIVFYVIINDDNAQLHLCLF